MLQQVQETQQIKIKIRIQIKTRMIMKPNQIQTRIRIQIKTRMIMKPNQMFQIWPTITEEVFDELELIICFNSHDMLLD